MIEYLISGENANKLRGKAMIQKDIKVHKMTGGANGLVDGALVRESTSWLIDDKIRVIGFELKCDLNERAVTTLVETSETLGAAVLSRSASISPEVNVQLGELRCRHTFCDVTIGAASFCAALGANCKELVVMWPEGHGLNLDDGDYLHLVADAIYFDGGGSLYVAAEAIIYYVER